MKEKKTKHAQVMIEFTFCMIVLLIMMYSLVKVFQWTGTDLARRRQAHDSFLTQDTGEAVHGHDKGDSTTFYYPRSTSTEGPFVQLEPNFYQPTTMNAVWFESFEN